MDDAGADELDVDASDVVDTGSVVDELSDVSTEVTDGTLLATRLYLIDAELGGDLLDSIVIIDKEGS